MVEWNISETWMPFMTGLVFVLPLFFMWLRKNSCPDETDINERARRLPMNKESRAAFLRTFGLGLGIVTVTTYSSLSCGMSGIIT
jgi:hypothetical protein